MTWVFENRLLRKMFGPKKGEVTWKSIRLQNEEFYALYSSPDIMQVIKPRGMRWARKVVLIVERSCAYKVLVGKPDEGTLLERPGHSWEDNTNMDLQEVGSGHGLHLSGSGYGRMAGCCKCRNKPSGSKKMR
jgi:hypothetical protein